MWRMGGAVGLGPGRRSGDMRLYVGNLAYSTDQQALREEFERFGEVSDAFVVMDRDTGRSKGFGFVEMPNDNEANEAMRQMDGAQVEGRTLKVNEATPQERRPRF